MSEFYHQLSQTTTKAEALRQAQLNLLRNTPQAVDLSRLPKSSGADPVAPESLAHPFYWAGFTMISSPW